MTYEEKVRENRLRRWAKRLNLELRKSRSKRWSVKDRGMYMLMDYTNNVFKGAEFELSLDDIERILEQYEKDLKDGIKKKLY